MIQLLSNALWLAIVGAFGFVGVSVLLHEFAGVHAFRIVCPDCEGYGGFDDEDCETCDGSGAVDDEDFPEDPDRERDWAYADEVNAW